MDDKIANNFIENISKHIQLLLRHYIPFDHQVEVLGHLNINVDLKSRVNYIVSEKCEKKTDANFIALSTSFHVSPDPTSSIPTPVPVKEEELQTPLPTPVLKRPSSTPVRKSPIKRVKIKCGPQSSAEESPSTSATHFVEEEQAIEDEEEDDITAINEPVSDNEDYEGEGEVEGDGESFMSLPDISVSEERVPDNGVEYTIIEYGTQMGKPLLVDNIGYSYNLRRATELDKEKVIWRCTKRNKNLRCTASVYQRGDNFTTGTRPHEHPPQRGMLTSALIYAEIRNQALLDFETPVSQIVARAMSIKGAEDDESVLPKEVNLRRMLQRFRNSQRAMKIINDNK